MLTPLSARSAHPLASDPLALLGAGGWQLDAAGTGVLLDDAARHLLGQGAVAPARLAWAELGDAADAWQQAALRALQQGGRFHLALPAWPGTGPLCVHGLCTLQGGQPAVLGALIPDTVPPAAVDAAASVADLLEVERRDALARLNRELRVPLNAMLGFAQLIEADALRSAEHDTLRRSHAILSSGRQMLDMVDELLVLREANLGDRDTTLMPLDVEATLRRWMLPEATFAADPQHAGPVHAWADPVLMRRLITIAGGREIARPPGTGTGSGAFVTFDASGAADTVRLRFLHGYRDPRSPDPRSQLRVALVRRLVQAMGGTLDIHELDDRVAFEVALRRAHVRQAPVPSSADLSGMGRAASPEPVDRAGAAIAGNVLCVEDDPATLLLMQHALGAYPGLRLRTASTAAEALGCLAEAMPDLVLLDLVLPGAGGEEVLRHLRRGVLPGGARGPACVVLSSIVDPEVRQRLIAAGADGYLPKPIRLRQLHDTLLRLLGPQRGGAVVEPPA